MPVGPGRMARGQMASRASAVPADERGRVHLTRRAIRGPDPEPCTLKEEPRDRRPGLDRQRIDGIALSDADCRDDRIAADRPTAARKKRRREALRRDTPVRRPTPGGPTPGSRRKGAAGPARAPRRPRSSGRRPRRRPAPRRGPRPPGGRGVVRRGGCGMTRGGEIQPLQLRRPRRPAGSSARASPGPIARRRHWRRWHHRCRPWTRRSPTTSAARWPREGSAAARSGARAPAVAADAASARSCSADMAGCRRSAGRRTVPAVATARTALPRRPSDRATPATSRAAGRGARRPARPATTCAARPDTRRSLRRPSRASDRRRIDARPRRRVGPPRPSPSSSPAGGPAGRTRASRRRAARR